MNNRNSYSSKLSAALFAALLILTGTAAQAGWTGIMNGAGVGWASVNVRSSTSQTNRVTTGTNMASPSAAMAPTAGYMTNAPLPAGAATNTYARIKGLPGGIWQAALHAANSGDGTDNAELENRVPITPAGCATINLQTVINQTQSEFGSNGFSGTISVDAAASAGTALWLRGFEFTNSMADLPPDDPSTTQNETIEYLKAHGVLVFESLLVGPFEFGGTNNNSTCPLLVPFSLASGNLSNLVFATDAVAKSNPMQIVCPGNIAVTCNDPVVYPPVNYSACGDVTVSYDPPAGTTFPVGTTPVTVTITDQDGNSTNCNFTVTVMDMTAPTVPVLTNLTGQCSVVVPTPTTIDICAATTNVITGTTTDPTVYNAQGTYTVNWTFNDGNGNTSTATQTVIVKDTIPPVPPVLSTLTGQCSVTVPIPTATDDCAGTVNGTTTDPLTYTAQGTYTVNWTFNDGNGNSSTATQTVIVKDTIPPVPPVLSTLTGQCTVTVPVPTATDNCAGTVNGTTTDPLTYSAQGTYTVNWTFNDGNGNSSTATQTVIVKDTIPPVPPVLSTLTGQCSVTVPVPTATDNCAGTVNGTTTDPLTYSAQGTYTVHWTFNDGNGKSSTANQTVIVKDTIPPVPPVLSSCSGALCQPVTLTPPVATDNCSGSVVGTTTTVFPITKLGTTVVTWTFNDGNGNTSTATQTVVIKGLTFDGFYSPINGVGGSYASPVLKGIARGCTVPVKFESECEGGHYRTAVPTVPTLSLLKYTSATAFQAVTGGKFTRVSTQSEDDWHFDWNTSGLSSGVYKIVATMQDGTSQYVFVSLK